MLACLLGALGVCMAAFGLIQLSAASDDRDAADSLAAERNEIEATADDRSAEADTTLQEAEGLNERADEINEAAATVDASLDAVIDSFRETKDNANLLVDCENEAVAANSFSANRDCYTLLLDDVVSSAESSATATESLATDFAVLEEEAP